MTPTVKQTLSETAGEARDKDAGLGSECRGETVRRGCEACAETVRRGCEDCAETVGRGQDTAAPGLSERCIVSARRWPQSDMRRENSCTTEESSPAADAVLCPPHRVTSVQTCSSDVQADQPTSISSQFKREINNVTQLWKCEEHVWKGVEGVSVGANVTTLRLGGLGLAQLDLDLSPLVNVSHVDLSANRLSSLPESFVTLNKCVRLNLSRNKLSAVPEVLYRGLYFVRYLDLSFNEIPDLSLAPLCAAYLVELDASHNLLGRPPCWLGRDSVSCLRLLDLSHNPLFREPLSPALWQGEGEVSVAAGVTSLRLVDTGLSRLHLAFLARFVGLTALSLGSPDSSTEPSLCNSLDELPLDTLLRTPLQRLDAAHCGLTCLPDRMDKLTHLRVIRISGNSLWWLPDSISELECVEVLDVTRCRLVYLPRLSNWTRLTELWAAHNDISAVPDVSRCCVLRVLDLYDNSLVAVPSLRCPDLAALDLGANYFPPSTFQAPDGRDYKSLEAALRSRLSLVRSDFTKIEGARSPSSAGSSYSGSWSGSSGHSYSSRVSLRCQGKGTGSCGRGEECWDDIDPNDAWDPECYSEMKKHSSSESLVRCRSIAAFHYRENYFCPFKQLSSFKQNLDVASCHEEEEPGQFADL